MRIWNGLRIGDIVIYNENKYSVTRLYEIENKKVCDLKDYKTGENVLKEIDISECIKED